MSELTAKYVDGLYEDLRDPIEAAAYLNAAVEDGDQQGFLLALRDVAEARGIAQTARSAGLNRENIYRMLSATGNPQLASLKSLLHSLGLRLSIEADLLQPTLPRNTETILAESSESYHTAES
ncbi:MAG: putative addiction module antidote protein [Caldilineaceae bacterium]|nr:putative addiction module antidote protein [Caldilineaceae bacterium]MBP8106998.1 putative addiction module antidote protein [Caldilineaceae bacterium]MBP8122008.1 putative addiction module antidote protein [Caldilineaceae bacterium]MBP9072627.1 putative addiction module antidote protein [Caldilineaceae bacterium]